MEMSGSQAAKIIGVTPRTIYNYVDRGVLPGRREGLKRRIRIRVEDLREFAKQYQLKFNEEYHEQLQNRSYGQT